MRDIQLTLFILPEKQYANTTWYTSVMAGIETEAQQQHVAIHIIDSRQMSALETDSVVVLLGSSVSFVADAIKACLQYQLKPLVAGFEFVSQSTNISYVTINRRHSMFEIVRLLAACGASRIALFGVNSAIQTDMLRYDGWRDALEVLGTANIGHDIFYSDQGIQHAVDNFLLSATRYDAVACANDYCAVYLLSALHKQKIHIPDNLMVTGFGNTLLSRCTDPPLTTVDLHLYDAGIQAVHLYRNLQANKNLMYCASMIQSQIITRASTRPLQQALCHVAVPPRKLNPALPPSFEQDIRPVYALESALSALDETDVKILCGVQDNIPYAELSEKLFLSESALRYRMNRLLETTETKNKAALSQMIQTFIPLYRTVMDKCDS